MSIYTTMKIKPNELPHYNNLMYNNIIFKLERVDVRNLFNNQKNEAIFHENIEKLNNTKVRPDFNSVEFSKDANYDISVDMLGNIPIYSFTTKSTGIKVISIVDVLNKSDSSKYMSDRIKEALFALEGFKKLGKITEKKK